MRREEKSLEMERKKYRRSKGVQIPGIHIKKKRKAGCTCERENKKSGGSYERSMGDRKEKIRR